MALKAAVCGVGRFGQLHLDVLDQIPGIDVVAIADIDEQKLQSVAEKYDLVRYHTNPYKLIEAKEIDVIDIVSDEASHAPLAIAALQAGKHVFVEKPLATTFLEAKRIDQVAKQSPGKILVGHISRFSQPYVSLKRQVDSGGLGQLRTIRASRDFNRSWYEQFGQRVHPVFESGIHDLDLIMWYTSSPWTSVVAEECLDQEGQQAQSFSALIRFEDDMLAVVQSAWFLPDKAPYTLIDTLDLRGTIKAEIELFGTKGVARYQTTNNGLEIWNDERTLQPDMTLWPTHFNGISGAIKEEMLYFVNCLTNDRPLDLMPMEAAVESLYLAEAIVQSAQEKSIIYRGSDHP